MFYFSDAPIICSLLLLLILFVALTEGSIPVTLREGSEYLYVKKCAILVTSPDVDCCSVKTNSILPVCRSESELLA